MTKKVKLMLKVDDDLWQSFKQICFKGASMNAHIEELIREKVNYERDRTSNTEIE